MSTAHITTAILSLLLVSCGPPKDPQGTTGTHPPGADEAGGGEEPPGDPAAEPTPGAAEGGEGEATPSGGDEPPILTAHNRYRASHCAAPLTWSDELAAEAKRWVTTLASHGCAFDHNPSTRYGENLAYFAPAGSVSEPEVADGWYREKSIYDFSRPGFSFEAGHFTQLVWAGSKRLGCASRRCGGGEIWVCNYDPPGNMQGDFERNVARGPCK